MRDRPMTGREAARFGLGLALGVGLGVWGIGSADAGVMFGHSGLSGGARWDAKPRTISGGERSLDGGLRYSVEGGSYQAFRDMFHWTSVPSVNEFQQTIALAFAAWTETDPATGLGTYLSFVPDLGTPTVQGIGWATLNTNGAEIDMVAHDRGNDITSGYTRFNWVGSNATLTTGGGPYSGAGSISGADIQINSNPGAVYSLSFFRRLLTHEIGHALGLGDAENADSSPVFVDDNYDGSTSTTARETLTNSWAGLVDPLNPANSPLSLYEVNDGDPGIDTFGVDILMESSGLGIGVSNPQDNLTPMTHDEFGIRQFLYPYLDPGDTDGDRDIDDADLGTLFVNFTGPIGSAGAMDPRGGDTDLDGDIDDADLGTAFATFTGPGAASATVPEPASLVMMLWIGWLAARHRR